MKSILLCALFLISFAIPIFPQEESGEESPGQRKPLIPNDNLVFGQSEFLDLGIGADLGFNDGLWADINARMNYTGGPFNLVADLTFTNEGKYAPTRVMLPAGNIMGFYLFLNEGGILYDQQPFHLSAGRFKLYDEIDSPYSLFINSMGHAAVTMNMRYESNHFIYQSRWIELNNRNAVSSPAWNEYQKRKEVGDWTTPVLPDPADTTDLSDWGFPDRGVNYKIYAVKVNDWRFGLLNAVVYTGRSFDFEYFLNPIPPVFISYANSTPGRPWSTDSNENALIGLFWDIDKKDDWNAYAQVLVDDFALGFLKPLYDGFSDNPWKAAWALGGRKHTSLGRFGFHHGGALKFTYEPIGTDGSGRYENDAAATAYGYTYYPETRYYDTENENKVIDIFIEDNMVGYKYGQNNLAFQIDYQNIFHQFLVTAELELVLAGANSPANPWQDHVSRSNYYDSGNSGSQLLDGPIEKRLELRLNVSRKIGHYAFWGSLAFGGRFNKLELKPSSSVPLGNTVDNDIWIWKSTENHELIFRISFGLRYTLNIL